LDITAQGGDGFDFVQGGDSARHGERTGNRFPELPHPVHVDTCQGSFPFHTGKEEFSGKGFDGFGGFDEFKAGLGLPAVNQDFAFPGVYGYNHPFPAYLLYQGFQEGDVHQKFPFFFAFAFFPGIPHDGGADDDLPGAQAHEFPGPLYGPDSPADPALGAVEQGLYQFYVVSFAHGGIQVYHRHFAVAVEFFRKLPDIIVLGKH
jgi:hypothetical protein